MPGFLNKDNIFIKGFYKGEALADVADEEPEYLEWLLKTCDLTYIEEDSIKEILKGSD